MTQCISRLSLIVLLLLISFVFVERLLVPRPPFGVDVMAYAVIAHEMPGEKSLYTDLWDHKPPAIYVTYAVAEMLSGYAPRTLILLNIFATIVTLLGAYRAGKVFGGTAGGLWAASFWTVLSGAAFLEGRDPNAEFFINPCVMWAFALLAEAKERSLGVRRALVVGALFAVGSFYKPVVVAAALLLACVHILLPPAGEKNRKRAFLDVFVIGAVGAVCWFALFGYYAATNLFTAFSDAVITYNSHYTGSMLGNITQPLGDVSESKLILMNALGILLLGASAVIFKKDRRAGALLAALTISSWLMVASPGKFYAHYFLLWLAPVVVGAGWMMSLLTEWFASRAPLKFMPVPQAAGALALVALLMIQVPFYRRAMVGNWTDLTQMNLNVAESLGGKIDGLLASDETFYVWGSEPGLYFWSQRSPPTGVFYLHHQLDGPLAEKLSQQVAADLTRTKPELLVVSKKAVAAFAPPPAWLTEDYVPLPNDLQTDTHTLFMRRGGKLEARLAKRETS